MVAPTLAGWRCATPRLARGLGGTCRSSGGSGKLPVGRSATCCLAVFVGSWTALAAVSGLAVLLGRVLLRYVSLTAVQYVGAVLCLALAVLTLITALS